MIEIKKNLPSTKQEVKDFISKISFVLPCGFINFLRESNGAIVYCNDNYLNVWPLTELIQLNKNYNVELYAPDYFIFGSNGGGNAFAIQKSTGFIFSLPFIVMSNDDAVFLAKEFNEFLNYLEALGYDLD